MIASRCRHCRADLLGCVAEVAPAPRAVLTAAVLAPVADGRAPHNRRSSLMFMSFLLVLLAGVGVGFLAERALHGPRGHGTAPTLWLPAGLNP